MTGYLKNFSNSILNLDINPKKFFTKQVDDDLFELIRDPVPKNFDLNRDIYYRPSHFPMINALDQKQGSCFKNLSIPTASFIFKQHKQNFYKKQKISACVDLESYVRYVHDTISDSIDKIYDSHPQVLLSYSGGIDSLVLLAHIIQKNLQNRTRLVIFRNFTQSHPSCLHINKISQNLINELTEEYEFAAVDWLDIKLNDICDIFNHGTLTDLRCYSARYVLDRYKNSAVIFGWHGNQALLHKEMFLDEILLTQPKWKLQLDDHISSKKDFYTSSLKTFDTNKSLIPIEDRFLVPKPWMMLDGVNNNKVYCPIGDNNILMLTRLLDFSKIHPDVILDAIVARNLIDMSCASLSKYIFQESIRESDSLSDINLPKQSLAVSKLKIPSDLRHDAQGLKYILEEIRDIDINGYLSINTAVSIKALQSLETYCHA